MSSSGGAGRPAITPIATSGQSRRADSLFKVKCVTPDHELGVTHSFGRSSPERSFANESKPAPVPKRDNRTSEGSILQLHCDYLEWHFACTLGQMGKGLHMLYCSGVFVYVLSPCIWTRELGVDVGQEHSNRFRGNDRNRVARPALSARRNFLRGYCRTPVAIQTGTIGNRGGSTELTKTLAKPRFLNLR